jgi:hypothetical protein
MLGGLPPMRNRSQPCSPSSSGPYIEDPAVREIYVDSLEARVDLSGSLRLDFCAQRWNPATVVDGYVGRHPHPYEV